MRIRLHELAHASRPGEPGIRYTERGVWIPLGLRPEYASPMVQSRRYWHEQQVAGGRQSIVGLRPLSERCTYCTLRVGAGFVETELYLAPMLPAPKKSKGAQALLSRAGFELRPVCGTCATSEMSLDFGYCLVAERDWGECAREGIDVVLTPSILAVKREQIARALRPLQSVVCREDEQLWDLAGRLAPPLPLTYTTLARLLLRPNH